MATKTIYFRILGYLTTIVMHTGNIIYLHTRMQEKDILEDPKLTSFRQLQSRYLTCWTFGLHILYAWIGLICDGLTLSNSKDKVYKLPKRLQDFRDTLFCAIVWPTTWTVFAVFWSLYIYDRSLIYPDFVDKAVPLVSNHIMHTAIVPAALWEVWCQPRAEPKSHRRYMLHATFYFVLYMVVFNYTYVEHGVWLYPIFGILYGTLFYPLIKVFIGFMSYGFYCMQWPLSNYLWSNKVKSKKIK